VIGVEHENHNAKNNCERKIGLLVKKIEATMENPYMQSIASPSPQAARTQKV
jgi:hypothetical protein